MKCVRMRNPLVFDELLYNLAYGKEQKAAPKNSIQKPLVIGWGRRDRVCFPSQAKRALEFSLNEISETIYSSEDNLLSSDLRKYYVGI